MVAQDNNLPDGNDPAPARAKRKLRWWQFSLRTLLLFTAACAGLAWWVSYPLERARQQRIAVERLRKLGAQITYDYEIVDWDVPNNRALVAAGQTPQPEPPGPGWLRSLLGVDFLAKVVRIEAFCRDPVAAEQHHLDYRYLRREDLALLNSLTELKYLRILGDGCDDSSLDFLQSLRRLKTLEIQGDIDDDGLDHISRSRDLASLTLVVSRKITERGVAKLAALKSLDVLDISSTQVKGCWLLHLAELPRLRLIRARGPTIAWTDDDLRGVVALPHLKELDISDNEITDSGITLLSGLSDLESLGLSGTRISTTFPGCATLSPKLRTLGLYGTQVANDGLRTMARFPHLQVLDLTATKVTDGGLVYLRNNTELEELSLPGAGIDGSGLKHLERLVNLKFLKLGQTQVGDAELV